MKMQTGILPGLPAHGRFIELTARPEASLAALEALPVGESLVIGLGPALVARFGAVAGLHGFRAVSGVVDVPSTQADLWLWFRGEDRGEIAKQARQVLRRLPDFEVVRQVDGFKYAGGLDLSGYEDGTENPEGEAAIKATFAPDGSSFVTVQQWVHRLERFDPLPEAERDNIIGRRIKDNVELTDAPEFAHVKRTAQESFTPEAFMLRRSMPWAENGQEGLNFVAFGNSFQAFEAQQRRMAGLEDGIADGLYRFTQPITGANYWCPPMREDRLDLTGIAP